MLIANEDGTFTAGPLDVICILKDEKTGRFHPAFFEESPFPGPVDSVDKTDVVRLKSMMHHTAGFATLEDAQQNISKDLGVKIKTPETNVCREPISWDGWTGIVWICYNWIKRGETFSEEAIAL